MFFVKAFPLKHRFYFLLDGFIFPLSFKTTSLVEILDSVSLAKSLNLHKYFIAARNGKAANFILEKGIARNIS